MTVIEGAGSERRQPWVHELSITVHGNATALSAPDGQMGGSPAEGLYVDDRRVLRTLHVLLGDEPSEPVAGASAGARAHFLASTRHLGDPGADPTVELHRHRQLVDNGLHERIEVVSRAAQPVKAELVVRLSGDGADIAAVKAGFPPPSALPARRSTRGIAWSDARHATRVSCQPAPDSVSSHDSPGRVPARPGVQPLGEGATLVFLLEIGPGERVSVLLEVDVARTAPTRLDSDPGATVVDWHDVRVRGDDPRLGPAVHTSLEDLRQLLLTDPADSSDVFAGAGTPWYLTLFGRDALWAARMMLPFGTALAGGTLRALARRQGVRVDQGSAEAPGKIPHELRRSSLDAAVPGLRLPPVYYGTIDATPLWVTLLYDAWRWGLPEAEVVALLPHLHAALRWLTAHRTQEGDGLLRYVDESGSGLVNQGWKDSADAVRWRDGRVAEAPIALVEAQAYAVEAALAGATLLDAFGEQGAGSLRDWAAELRASVERLFWVGPATSPHLGIAVDGHGDAVDGLASNMGHVLGTGTLDARGVERVARSLTSPQLLGAYGVSTLAHDNGGYNPIGYHTGSVWTHDTAICAWGLQREGRRVESVTVARTLLASGAAFHYRWPELYAGDGVLGRPAPYPASCRPQAWSAASAAVLLWVALGFEPDAAGRRLVLRPTRPAAYGAFEVRGLRFAGAPLSLRVVADGGVEVLEAPPGLDLRVE